MPSDLEGEKVRKDWSAFENNYKKTNTNRIVQNPLYMWDRPDVGSEIANLQICHLYIKK
jgi:hypothetical protein